MATKFDLKGKFTENREKLQQALPQDLFGRFDQSFSIIEAGDDGDTGFTPAVPVQPRYPPDWQPIRDEPPAPPPPPPGDSDPRPGWYPTKPTLFPRQGEVPAIGQGNLTDFARTDRLGEDFVQVFGGIRPLYEGFINPPIQNYLMESGFFSNTDLFTPEAVALAESLDFTKNAHVQHFLNMILRNRWMTSQGMYTLLNLVNVFGRKYDKPRWWAQNFRPPPGPPPPKP